MINKILVFSFIVAGLAVSSNDVKSSDLQKVDIGYSRLRISLPVFVAKEKGFFEKYGIDANLLSYDTAQPLMQALLSGKVDVAGYTALPITYNGMIRKNKKLYFTSTMIEDNSHRISYLLRPKSKDAKDIKIKTIKDLKGKRIGILPTIAYKAWILAILKNNGVDAKDVFIQQVAPMQQIQALKSGGVDALFTNDPAATSAIQVGAAELVSKDVECPKYIQNPFAFGSFNVSKKWADENSKTFKNIVKALDEAVMYVNKNPQKSKEAMKKFLPVKFKPHVKYYPDAKYLTSNKSTTKTFQDVADLYLNIGIIKKPLSLDGLVINQDR